uniref:Uncharacterized protein n=1 Tax=Siphoviridae sp. ctxvK3 TaxID=2827975 RepID=A0A8S5SGE7_9CAUD|nr:MAG TPA: hypothetical protein [Siphoviridae sp. ctxvK3]
MVHEIKRIQSYSPKHRHYTILWYWLHCALC